ncbi:hypothetical protein Bhyg_05420 [Pseudolycoriella hygida]|uniref:Regulatory protein zeste n=1 Tax=Pseudolycoriella hygida TaxID=35572 RepID=A0A9Q0NH53_9DIPT|nr:hypothetical protein Bhyg_05420 [Pseudolycoriella hygida]
MDEVIIDEVLVCGSVVDESKYVAKQPKTTNKQIKKIIDTMQENEKLEFTDVMWSDLSNELNELGPPIHSIKEWRKVWSNYKYNHKKSRISARSIEEESRVARTAPTAMESIPWEDAFKSFRSEFNKKFESIVQNQQRFLNQQQEIIDNQNQILQNQKVLLEQTKCCHPNKE